MCPTERHRFHTRAIAHDTQLVTVQSVQNMSYRVSAIIYDNQTLYQQSPFAPPVSALSPFLTHEDGVTSRQAQEPSPAAQAVQTGPAISLQAPKQNKTHRNDHESPREALHRVHAIIYDNQVSWTSCSYNSAELPLYQHDPYTKERKPNLNVQPFQKKQGAMPTLAISMTTLCGAACKTRSQASNPKIRHHKQSCWQADKTSARQKQISLTTFSLGVSKKQAQIANTKTTIHHGVKGRSAFAS